MALLKEAGDAEDVVQETFAKYAVLRRKPDNVAGYLFRMARNEAWSLLRRRRLWFLGRRRLAEQTPLLRATADGRPPEEREVLETALLRLPAKQREVVILKHFEDMTFHQIAHVVGCPANTAASRYRYAIDKLRSILNTEDSVE